MHFLKEKYPEFFKKGCEISTQPGWDSLLDELLANIREQKVEITVLQIKEKFARLRFYYSGGNEKVSEMVRHASGKSAEICEVCGEPGKICESRKGWYNTLCPKCLEVV